MNKKMGGRRSPIAMGIVFTMLYTATAMAGTTVTSSGEITSAATLSTNSIEGTSNNANLTSATNTAITSEISNTNSTVSQPTAITNTSSITNSSASTTLSSGYQQVPVTEVSSYEIYEGSCSATLSTPYGTVKSSVSAYDSSFAALMCRKLADAVEQPAGHFFVRGYVYASSYNTPYISINSIGGSAN